ncbi:MAG TPA: fused response regulator/phosphatase [Pseudobacteroides sp.]|uniref:PP2C family protein-serine/threonine phosphatase n=1 Tax=Pseudobacteroides sp. TaxID=1968840 RepID=UPI002F92529A
MNNWKFLLVDDSNVSIKILEDILINNGYTDITSVNSAQEAIDFLLSKNYAGINRPIDIIITDLFMPGINGIEFCRKIHRIEEYRDIPIVMITSSNDIDNLKEAFDSGIIDYIRKPFNPIELVTRIKAILRFKEEVSRRQLRELEIEDINRNLIEDLSIANHLQFQMLPKNIISKPISIKGYYVPVTFLGGDLYYWHRVGGGKYGVALIDVMGHGTATSMICMYIRSLLPELISKSTDSVELVKSLNKYMRDFNNQLTQVQYHFTMIYIIVDVLNKTIDYVNAGHPPVYLLEKSKEIKLLDKGCIPIGIMDDIEIENEIIRYTETSCIFMYSDGLKDLVRDNNITFEYILSLIDINNINSSFTLPIEKFLDRIKQMSRPDDISVVTLELR